MTNIGAHRDNGSEFPIAHSINDRLQAQIAAGMQGQPIGPHGHHEAVDRFRGADLAERTRKSVELFRDEVLPTLPIGPRTRAAFQELLTSLLETPGGIAVAQALHYSYHDEFRYDQPLDPDTPPTPPGPPKIEAGQLQMDYTLGRIEDAGAEANIPLTWIEMNRLASYVDTWHELSHTLQHAYEITQHQGPTADGYQNFPKLAAAVGIEIFPATSNQLQQEANAKAAVEGFAEGLAIQAVVAYLRKVEAAKYKGATDAQIQAFATALIRPDRVNAHEVLREVLEKFATHSSAPEADRAKAVEELYQIGFPRHLLLQHILSFLGYGAPMNQEQTEAIMRAMP